MESSTVRPPVPAARASRPRERRILLIGLLASVAAHAVLVLVVRGGAWLEPAGGAPAAAGVPARTPAGTEVVAIRTVEVEPGAEPRDAAEQTGGRPDRAARVDPADESATPTQDGSAERQQNGIAEREQANAAGPPSDTPARDRFAATLEALRPRLLDPRLRPRNVDALRTDHERAALRVYARINALNDSIMAELERGRRATDWTFTDEQGRRWGVSPGKLHLGDIELPLPLSFSPTPEQRERIREWDELQAQSQREAARETFDERVDAMRERREAAREAP